MREKMNMTEPVSFANIFSDKPSTWQELEKRLTDTAAAAFQQILPHQDITAERVEAITARWGDIEPIFTYVRRYPRLRPYIAELAAQFDTDERWKAWRYDMKNKTVARQIGWLNEIQREAWMRDYAAEVGDFEVKEGEASKPEQIRQTLTDAITRDRHLNNEQASGSKFPFSQEVLGRTLGAMLSESHRAAEIRDAELQALEKIESAIDAIILVNGASRAEQVISGALESGSMVSINSKNEGALKVLKPYMTDDSYRNMSGMYKAAEKAKQPIASEALLSAKERTAIAERIQKARHAASSADITLAPLGIVAASAPAALYQKRAELQAIKNILRLATLETRNVVLNLLVEGKKKGEGATIVGTLSDLKKVYKGSGFVQDIANIETILQQQATEAGKRQLAIVVSDNPSHLWQAGKYPIGNGSCQHYAEGSIAQALMGYVGDAHIKVGYLFDVRRLPDTIQTRLRAGETMQSLLSEIAPPDILRSTVARSIVKVTKSKEGKPVVFLEPIYSVINKADRTMDRYFELFAELFIAEPMRAAVARGGTETAVTVPTSRNPSGQYEDGAEGGPDHDGLGVQHRSYSLGARIISKERPLSDEEHEVIERMRSSS